MVGYTLDCTLQNSRTYKYITARIVWFSFLFVCLIYCLEFGIFCVGPRDSFSLRQTSVLRTLNALSSFGQRRRRWRRWCYYYLMNECVCACVILLHFCLVSAAFCLFYDDGYCCCSSCCWLVCSTLFLLLLLIACLSRVSSNSTKSNCFVAHFAHLFFCCWRRCLQLLFLLPKTYAHTAASVAMLHLMASHRNHLSMYISVIFVPGSTK